MKYYVPLQILPNLNNNNEVSDISISQADTLMWLLYFCIQFTELLSLLIYALFMHIYEVELIFRCAPITSKCYSRRTNFRVNVVVSTGSSRKWMRRGPSSRRTKTTHSLIWRPAHKMKSLHFYEIHTVLRTLRIFPNTCPSLFSFRFT